MIDPSLIRSAQAAWSVWADSRTWDHPPTGSADSIHETHAAYRKTQRGTNMQRPHKFLLLALALVITTPAVQSAQIHVKAVKQQPPYEYGWEITSAQISPNEIRRAWMGHHINSPSLQMLFTGVWSGRCGSQGPTPPVCLHGLMPTGGNCSTADQAMQLFQQIVGRGIRTYTPSPPTSVYLACGEPPYSNYYGWELLANTIATPIPTSCTTSDAQLTIRGRVGERAKASTNLNIQCDSPATLRLTLTEGGLVKVGGEGEVRLLFGKNGRDVLDVSGTAPPVDIEGELTKSPSTAGTYRGSSVLRLEIL